MNLAPLHAELSAARELAASLQSALEQSRRENALVRQIQHLYRIEANLREHRAGPRLRQALRAGQSRPVNAAPSFIPSSKAADVAALIPSLIFVKSSPACPT
jgi:hypothetical protein